MGFETIIGFTAGVLTTLSSLPQLIKIVKTKSAGDLSLGMWIALNIGIALWLTYGILTNDLPLIYANGVTIIFTLTILFLEIKYTYGRN